MMWSTLWKALARKYRRKIGELGGWRAEALFYQHACATMKTRLDAALVKRLTDELKHVTEAYEVLLGHACGYYEDETIKSARVLLAEADALAETRTAGG